MKRIIFLLGIVVCNTLSAQINWEGAVAYASAPEENSSRRHGGANSILILKDSVFRFERHSWSVFGGRRDYSTEGTFSRQGKHITLNSFPLSNFVQSESREPQIRILNRETKEPLDSVQVRLYRDGNMHELNTNVRGEVFLRHGFYNIDSLTFSQPVVKYEPDQHGRTPSLEPKQIKYSPRSDMGDLLVVSVKLCDESQVFKEEEVWTIVGKKMYKGVSKPKYKSSYYYLKN